MLKRLYHLFNNAIRMMAFYLYINVHINKTVFLLGTPTHNNIGDSAIVIAELCFLKKQFGLHVKEITTNDYKTYKKIVYHATINKLVFLHGGGNMGDLWYGEEKIRREMIMFLKAAHFIIFPQTLFYSNTLSGIKRKDESIPVYSSNKVTMFAREKLSFKLMKQLYPEAEVYVAPDIVCYLKGRIDISSNELDKDYLVVFRSDIEKLNYDCNNLVLFYLEQSGSYSITDMYCACDRINKRNRLKIVKKKLIEFSKCKAIITDRLHGMIFAYLLDKPCLVFNINNHKIIGSCEMLSNNLISIHNPNIDVCSEIDSLLKIPVYKSFYNNDYYFEMVQVINKYLHIIYK